jgi:hypothetical protein
LIEQSRQKLRLLDVRLIIWYKELIAMGTTSSQQKRVNESIRLSADFASVLLTGESVQVGGITVTSVNVLTDADSTTDIIASAPTLSGSIVTAAVSGGTAGDTHRLLFSTGATNFSLVYETEMNLLITDSPVAEIALANRDEIKRQLRVADTSDDTLIDELNIAASTYIRQRTGRDFTFATYTETIQPLLGEDIVRLQLAHYPVQQIDRIQVTDELDLETINITDTDAWDFLSEGYLWWVNDAYAFEYWPPTNNITYRAGYLQIPEDLRQACKSLVVAFYRAIGREGLLQERIGDYFYRAKTAKDFPTSVRQEIDDRFVEGVIARYTRHGMVSIG